MPLFEAAEPENVVLPIEGVETSRFTATSRVAPGDEDHRVE